MRALYVAFPGTLGLKREEALNHRRIADDSVQTAPTRPIACSAAHTASDKGKISHETWKYSLAGAAVVARRL